MPGGSVSENATTMIAGSSGQEGCAVEAAFEHRGSLSLGADAGEMDPKRRNRSGKLALMTVLTDRPSRILLVDDEQAILTLLSYPLRKDGYEVVEAADGPRGAPALRRGRVRPRRARRDDAASSTGWRCADGCARRARCRSSC